MSADTARGDRRGLDPRLTDFLLALPCASQHVNDLQQRSGLSLGDGVHVERALVGNAGHDINESSTTGHALGDVQSADVCGPSIVFAAHSQSPYVARALTRYVAGALILTALWQLQRKAWTRLAAVTRPSGTTNAGAAGSSLPAADPTEGGHR